MNDDDWLILKTISETKNLSKAADLLYTSQPALSYRIKNIEKELNTTIMIRTPVGIRFTPQGNYLVTCAEKMISHIKSIKEEISNWKNPLHGKLVLGCSTTFAHYDLPHILKGFLPLYPRIDISLKTGLSSQVTQMLYQDEITLAILRENSSWLEEKFLLKKDPICLASRSDINISDLSNYPRITYKTDSILQQSLTTWWNERFSTPPHIRIDTDRMAMCRRMVLQGLGWATLPASGLSEAKNLFTKKLFWKNGDLFVQQTWINYRKSALDIPAVKAFIDYLHNL